ncbi:MAG: helix-turn-helix domain-containing protein [Halobacteriales archaeon]|nr:helix-turn-helix domain-containing protein [Halobacteriales archaeon]
MVPAFEGGDGGMLPPDDAFSALGNETRMEILRTLGEADEPLTFSALRERVGMRDSGQFNYHLDQIRGHFVRSTEDGYDLHQAGRRVIEAVLSGAVTADPDMAPTRIDWPCPFCGSPTEVRYDARTSRPLKLHCTNCAGPESTWEPFEHGQLAALRFSPAGLRGRTPMEILDAAATWEHLENLAAYRGVCPRCSGRIDHSISVCDSHDTTDGSCPHCGRGYAIQHDSRCMNCIFDLEAGSAANLLLGTLEMLTFLTDHGINPLADAWGPIIEDAEETVLSTEPLRARFTFRIDDDSLSLTVDEEFSVVDSHR